MAYQVGIEFPDELPRPAIATWRHDAVHVRIGDQGRGNQRGFPTCGKTDDPDAVCRHAVLERDGYLAADLLGIGRDFVSEPRASPMTVKPRPARVAGIFLY